VYKRILLSLSLHAAPICFGADTAGDYFHRGAQFYIWGKKPEAKNEVITGLKLFPDDAQLNGLSGLLKKEEEQQQQQQQNQEQQHDQPKDQSKQDQNQQQQQSQQNQQKNDPSQQDQQEQNQKKDEQQQQKPKPSPNEKQQQQQAAQQAEKSKDDSEQKDRDEAYAAGKMTPEQARQLLDSQKGEEMMLPVKPEGKPADRHRPVRDW
jgi:hypothetical protein